MELEFHKLEEILGKNLDFLAIIWVWKILIFNSLSRLSKRMACVLQNGDLFEHLLKKKEFQEFEINQQNEE